MKLDWFAVITAVLLPLSAYAGMYSQPVLHLDSKTFKSVMANEHAAMVAFVAPWCGHCKNLGPEYTAAAQSLSPLIPFYAVDCDESSNRGLCAEYGVQGYPTIKGFPKAGKGAAKEYNGERKRGALVEYAKGLVPERVKKLRVQGDIQSDVQGFLGEKSELPHVLLVHPSSPSIPFLWKVLAHRFSNKLHLGYVRDTTSHDVLSLLGIYDSADTTRDSTRVVAWSPGSQRGEFVEYDGILKFNALLEWLQTTFTSAAPSNTKQRPIKAPQPTVKSTNKEKEQIPTQGQNDAAARRAKLEEMERRDKARREKAAEAARAQAMATEPEPETEKEATPVEDAADAAPAQVIEDASLPMEEVESKPVPEEAPDDEASARDVEVEKTEVVHEEL
ncbi:protein disulfide-isomerase domain [Cryptococcus neoformans var. grubii Br795]|nr:protein disulfide-isomerase domain [Cryptococcus neoformans var. grubii 125.91]OXG37934.1 protein disulfide-isomerase domain [Cryptococcus neoformans var. grubii Bt15]OXG52472.1 protein disulfide-isomerase domain [Cryptococcus neoformans var. grubii Th84]OXG86889.1 protein disulfide-isomerase domain [Cryptococcus neoformans var. grubii Br795]OXH15532.1 protein disulfide-isomerase [Cryptococcus neoformans var. grubii]